LKSSFSSAVRTIQTEDLRRKAKQSISCNRHNDGNHGNKFNDSDDNDKRQSKKSTNNKRWQLQQHGTLQAVSCVTATASWQCTVHGTATAS